MGQSDFSGSTLDHGADFILEQTVLSSIAGEPVADDFRRASRTHDPSIALAIDVDVVGPGGEEPVVRPQRFEPSLDIQVKHPGPIADVDAATTVGFENEPTRGQLFEGQLVAQQRERLALQPTDQSGPASHSFPGSPSGLMASTSTSTARTGLSAGSGTPRFATASPLADPTKRFPSARVRARTRSGPADNEVQLPSRRKKTRPSDVPRATTTSRPCVPVPSAVFLVGQKQQE